MNSPAETKNALENNRKQTADPFAADIFAAAKKGEINSAIETPRVATAEKNEWVWRLPKAARSKKKWTILLQNLPAEFSENLPRLLAESLSNLLAENTNSIDFAFVENREIIPKSEKNDKNGEAENSWKALIAIEPDAAGLTIEIEDFFAGWLVDKMLGETVSESVTRRDLTSSEVAVLEYLFVNLIYEANVIIKKPLFKFVSLSRKTARPITSEKPEISNSMIVSTWQTFADAPPSLVKIFLAYESLEALQSVENTFSNSAERQAKLLHAVEHRVSEVRTRLFLGETQATLADIAGIETGDVILIERYDLTANRNEFYGNAELFLGDGDTFRVGGSIEASTEFELPDDSAVSFEGAETLVRRVNSSHNLQISISYFQMPANASFIEKAEKSMNEDFDNLSDEPGGDFADESNGDGISLENLAVTLRVELEARRLSLAEVGNLRVNQIIELGARATDPVNLIIENKTIARGELVEVEERLGVRIIQILR